MTFPYVNRWMLPSLSPLFSSLSLPVSPLFSLPLSDSPWQDVCSRSRPVLMCGWMTPLKACLAAAPAISGSEVFGSLMIDSCQVWHCQPDTVCSNCLLSLPLSSSSLAPRRRVTHAVLKLLSPRVLLQLAAGVHFGVHFGAALLLSSDDFLV